MGIYGNEKNIPIISNYDADNLVVRGVVSYLAEVLPDIEPFFVKLGETSSWFISNNSLAVVFLFDNLSEDTFEKLEDIRSQILKYKLTVLEIAAESDIKDIRKCMSDVKIISCGNRDDIAQCKRIAGLYLSRFVPKDKRTILLVDDAGEVLRTVKSWLDKKYEVIMTKSGEMAFRYLNKKIPDLILLDYEMPGMNGKDVFQRLKKQMITSEIPVFFLTSKSDRDIVMEIMSLHPEGYILKTESKENVLKRIDGFFADNK